MSLTRVRCSRSFVFRRSLLVCWFSVHCPNTRLFGCVRKTRFSHRCATGTPASKFRRNVLVISTPRNGRSDRPSVTCAWPYNAHDRRHRNRPRWSGTVRKTPWALHNIRRVTIGLGYVSPNSEKCAPKRDFFYLLIIHYRVVSVYDF